VGYAAKRKKKINKYKIKTKKKERKSKERRKRVPASVFSVSRQSPEKTTKI
jgi:hypothetical protein